MNENENTAYQNFWDTGTLPSLSNWAELGAFILNRFRNVSPEVKPSIQRPSRMYHCLQFLGGWHHALCSNILLCGSLCAILIKRDSIKCENIWLVFFKVEQVQGITITIFNRNMTVIFLSLILLRNMQSVFESSCH